MVWLRRDKDCIALVVAWAILVQAALLSFKGLRLSVEWLQPIEDDPNGFQLEREGTLWANVSKAF